MTTTTWEDIKANRRENDGEAVERGRKAAEEAFLLGEMIRTARERLGLSQTELARRVGTSQSAVARIEAGGGNPSLESVHRFADALGMRVVIAFQDAPAA